MKDKRAFASRMFSGWNRRPLEKIRFVGSSTPRIYCCLMCNESWYHIITLSVTDKGSTDNISTSSGISMTGNVGVMDCQICWNDLKMRGFDRRRADFLQNSEKFFSSFSASVRLQEQKHHSSTISIFILVFYILFFTTVVGEFMGREYWKNK